MTKEQKINLTSTLILIGFCIAIYYHFIVKGIYFHKGIDANGFLCCPEINFSDLPDKVYNSKDLHPYNLDAAKGEKHTISEYFPFSFTFILYPLSFVGHQEVIVIGVIISIIVMLWGNYYFLTRSGLNNEIVQKSEDPVSLFRNLFILSFLTYPFLMQIDRMNAEAFLLAFELLFLIFYLRNKFYLSATFLAFATAMKLYPAALFFLFIKDRKYKELLFGAGLALFITILALFLMKGEVMQNINGMLYELNLSKTFFATDSYVPKWGVPGSTTLFDFLKVIVVESQLSHLISPSELLIYVEIIALIIGIALFVYLQKYEEEKWKIVTVLVFCTILFNYISFAYKSISIFIALWMFINSKKQSRYDIAYSVMFGLLLIPMRYNIFATKDYDSLSFVNPMIIISFIVLIIYERFSESR